MRDPLDHRAAATPDREALVVPDDGGTWTYGEFDEAVEGTARRLAGLDVEGGDRVGLLADTSLAAARLVHAVFRAGATLVPLNARLTADELRRQVDVVGLDAVVCDPDATDTATELARDVPVIALGDDTGPSALSTLDPGTIEPWEWDLGDPMVVLFTSGTTGDPKAVPLTAANLLASATASAFRLGVLPGDRWLLCLPIYHMGGLAPILRSTLYGTAVIVHEGFDAGAVARATREHEATGVSLVPTQLKRIFDVGADLADTLRFVLLGGAPAPDELVAEAEARDVLVHPTYGTTETASQIATARPAEAFEYDGTVGQPLVGTAVTIVDGSGDPLPRGETGEIAVAGPTVTPGYLDAETPFGPHGLHTGDLGYRDEDGRLWVIGRVDETIVTGGENVAPGEVEAVLREHPAVEDAVVVGLDDPEWGERVAALVVRADDAAIDAADLESFCRECLAGFKVPRTIAFADSIPRTASGTVDRETVRVQLRDEDAGGGGREEAS